MLLGPSPSSFESFFVPSFSTIPIYHIQTEKNERLFAQKFVVLHSQIIGSIVIAHCTGYLLPGHMVDIPQSENLAHLAIFH